jgi:hypothetical protein
MIETPLYRPRVTGEPTLAVDVSALGLPPLALGLPVGVMPFALLGTSPGRTNRQAGRSGICRAVCRPDAARLPRDAHPHGVGVPTRAATFPGTGLPGAGGRCNLTFVLSEVE